MPDKELTNGPAWQSTAAFAEVATAKEIRRARFAERYEGVRVSISDDGRWPDFEYSGLLLEHRLVLTKYLILIVSAIVACVVTYLAGYHAGARLRKEGGRQASLIMGVTLYQIMETNQVMAQRILGTRIANVARDYERRFGIPEGTNAFAQLFLQAKAIADRMAKALVSSGEASTNFGNWPLTNVPADSKRRRLRKFLRSHRC